MMLINESHVFEVRMETKFEVRDACIFFNDIDLYLSSMGHILTHIYDDLLPVGLTAQLIVASQRPGFKFHSGLSRHYISSDKKKCKDHTFRTSFQSPFEIHDLFWDHFAEIKITRFFFLIKNEVKHAKTSSLWTAF